MAAGWDGARATLGAKSFLNRTGAAAAADGAGGASPEAPSCHHGQEPLCSSWPAIDFTLEHQATFLNVQCHDLRWETVLIVISSILRFRD